MSPVILGSGLGVAFRPVLRPAPLATFYAQRVVRTSNDMVTNAGKILNLTTTDQHNRVLLQVVSFTRYVGQNLKSIRQPYPGHFTKRRIWLSGRNCSNLNAYTSLLRRAAGS